MKTRIAAAAAITAALLSSSAWGALVYDGASYDGGLQAMFSSENGAGSYAPLDPVTWTVSMSDGGWLNRPPVSGALAVYAPAVGGSIEGKLFHIQGVLDTPVVNYLSMGIGAHVYGRIFLSSLSSSNLYYGWSLDEATSPDGGTAYYHGEGVRFLGPEYGSLLANDSHQQFGATSILAWQNGDLRATETGPGFVQFSVALDSWHYGGDTGPGQETSFDFWLALSETPFTTMPVIDTPVVGGPSAVPEPESLALVLAGFGAMIWRTRRRKA